jgi:hypothetical protein
MNYWVVGSKPIHRTLFDSCLSHFTGDWRYFDSPEYEVLQTAYQDNPIYIFVLGTKEGIPPLIRQHFKCVLFKDTRAPTGTLDFWKVYDVTDGEYTAQVTDLIYNLVYHMPQEAKMPVVDGRVSVTIPVGPNEVYLQWLPECLDSVIKQTYPADELILIDDSLGVLGNKYLDMLGITVEPTKGEHGELRYDEVGKPKLVVWRSPWNLGVPDAFNIGIALSSNNLVFMLGSDDKLMPDCLNECVAAYLKHKIEGWYAVTYVTQGGRQDYIPNNAAMVTKKLWNYLGGFPPSAGVGGCDAVCLSILMAHDPARIILVKQGTSLCWLREHPDQDTKRNAWLFSGEIVSIRNKETARWKPRP